MAGRFPSKTTPFTYGALQSHVIVPLLFVSAFALVSGAQAAVKAAERTEPPAVVIPGGIKALGTMFRVKADYADRFLPDYCRALVNAVGDSPRNASVVSERIHRYFQLVSGLEALGTRQGNRVTVTVSGTGASSRQRASRVLDLLGLKIRTTAEEVGLQAGGSASQALRQELASALAIDTVEMQSAFEAGRPFSFEIVDGHVPVLLGERPGGMRFQAASSRPAGWPKTWRATFGWPRPMRRWQCSAANP